MNMTPRTKLAYIIIADGALDQVCETFTDAQREKRDLEKLGCTVRISTCPWDQQDALIAKWGI